VGAKQRASIEIDTPRFHSSASLAALDEMSGDIRLSPVMPAPAPTQKNAPRGRVLNCYL